MTLRLFYRSDSHSGLRWAFAMTRQSVSMSEHQRHGFCARGLRVPERVGNRAALCLRYCCESLQSNLSYARNRIGHVVQSRAYEVSRSVRPQSFRSRHDIFSPYDRKRDPARRNEVGTVACPLAIVPIIWFVLNPSNPRDISSKTDEMEVIRMRDNVAAEFLAILHAAR